MDVGSKRDDDGALGNREYWRFEETREHHGARPAGDRLVSGRYERIDIEDVPDDGLEGYSEALDLTLRWQTGGLGWHEPVDGRHISTFAEVRARADAEHAAYVCSERRVRELEVELRWLRGD